MSLEGQCSGRSSLFLSHDSCSPTFHSNLHQQFKHQHPRHFLLATYSTIYTKLLVTQQRSNVAPNLIDINPKKTPQTRTRAKAEKTTMVRETISTYHTFSMVY